MAHRSVRSVLATAVLLVGCSSPGVASDPDSIGETQTDSRSFVNDLVGTWESPGCSRDGSDCTVWTFGADGLFTYDFETDDYSDSHSTRWSVQQVADEVGRVSLEGAGIHLATIDDQGLSIQGEGNEYVKVTSGGSADDLALVDPGPLGNDMVGTWFRSEGAGTDSVAHPERLTLDHSGDFEASYGGEICAGVWTLGVAGDLGRNAGEPNEGSLGLYAGDQCNNTEEYEERPAWARINRFSATSDDGSLLLDGLEYRREPDS